MAQRKKWSPAEKFKIALLAIKGDSTMAEIVSKYAIHATQINAWKRQILALSIKFATYYDAFYFLRLKTH